MLHVIFLWLVRMCPQVPAYEYVYLLHREVKTHFSLHIDKEEGRKNKITRIRAILVPCY